MEVNIDKIVI